MKKHIITTLIIALMGATLSKAQNKYKETMSAAIAALDSAKNKEDYLKQAALFERIANAEPKEWLPLYYAAYANFYTTFWPQDNKSKDNLFDAALKLIERAKQLEENSELLALQSYVEYMKMAVDPMNRLELIEASQASLEKAEKLDPDNPRVYLIKGQNLYYTPEAYGGGKAAAKPLIEKAKEKFETYEPKDELAPSWGRKELERLLENE